MITRAALLAALVACGGSSPPPAAPTTAAPTPDAAPADDERAALVTECDSSMQVMGTNPEDLQTAMANVMLSCSHACDLGDETSCGHLDGFMETTCSAVISICDGMCTDTTKSPSLRTSSCRYATDQ